MARALVAVALAAVLLVAPGSGAQEPRRGGTLELVIALEPRCLNVLVSSCTVVGGVLEGAFRTGSDLRRHLRLVSKVDFTREPPFTLTYHLRPEARWSDGVPVTARDFVFTHRALLAHPPEFERPHERIRSVRALGPKTLRVVLDSRYAFWRDLFGVVLPSHALAGRDLATIWVDRIDDPRTGRPIGSGPFLVQEWKRGERLTLVRNPLYWGRRAFLDRIDMRFTLDPSVVQEFFRQGADVALYQFSEDLVTALRRVPDVRRSVSPTAPGWEHLAIRIGRGGHPALRNKRVRRALAFGIDRMAIVRDVFGEAGRELRPLDSVVLRSSNAAYRPNWGIYRYRPQEAVRQLRLAGCRRGGDGIFSCTGERLSFEFLSRNVIGRRVRTLELVQDQLRRVGIEVRREYATAAGHGQRLETGEFDVTLFAWFGQGGQGPGIKEQYGCWGSQNSMGYCQRLVTRELDQADRILDAEARGKLLNRADEQLANDVPVIPLFEIPSLTALRSTVRGFGQGLLFNPLWNAENWWLAR